MGTLFCLLWISYMLSLPGQHSNLGCRNSHTSSGETSVPEVRNSSQQPRAVAALGRFGVCSMCRLDQTIVGLILLSYSVPSVDWVLQALAAKISLHWAVQAQFFRFTATKFGQIFRRVVKAKSLRWVMGTCQYLSPISGPWDLMFVLSLSFPLYICCSVYKLLSNPFFFFLDPLVYLKKN